MNDGLSDKTIQCVACEKTFIFTARDQRFYASHEPPFDPPKRCKPCRDAKKAKYEAREAR